MARLAQRREDLLRDAVALVPRLLLNCGSSERKCEVFVGFRGDAVSLYFDQDPVYHFRSDGSLRRAFAKGLLYKAQNGELIALRRVETPSATQLQSTPLSASETEAFLSQAADDVSWLRTQFANRHAQILGGRPSDGDAWRRTRAWLESAQPMVVAAGPQVR